MRREQYKKYKWQKVLRISDYSESYKQTKQKNTKS